MGKHIDFYFEVVTVGLVLTAIVHPNKMHRQHNDKIQHSVIMEHEKAATVSC